MIHLAAFCESFLNRVSSSIFSGEGHLQGAEGGAGPRQGAGAQVRDVPEGDEAAVGGGGNGRGTAGEDAHGSRAAARGGDHDVSGGVPQVMEDQLALLVDAEGQTAL